MNDHTRGQLRVASGESLEISNSLETFFFGLQIAKCRRIPNKGSARRAKNANLWMVALRARGIISGKDRFMTRLTVAAAECCLALFFTGCSSSNRGTEVNLSPEEEAIV